MLGLLIIFVSLAIGFAGGYVMRGTMSRKRRAEYLKYEPYISPSRAKSPACLDRPDEGKRMRGVAPEAPKTFPVAKAESRPTNRDITRSFQDVLMNGAGPVGANPFLVDPHPKEPDIGSSRSATVEESLEELVALLQRGRQ
jgi:hypothetical protein